MANKIAARKQLARERGYTDKQWRQKTFKRALKPYVLASERQLGYRQGIFCEFVLCHVTGNFLILITDG